MIVSASEVRYIKLGRKGSWEHALREGVVPFGYDRASHELAKRGRFEEIKAELIELGRSPQAAARDVQEVADFYQRGRDCLWITFAHDRLWWVFAEPSVSTTGKIGPEPFRIRKTVGAWSDRDVNGNTLKMSYLSTKLTKVSNYRRTICTVSAKEYLLRRINGIEEPIVVKAQEAQTALSKVIVEALGLLDWYDFETLADLIFARSGWNRVSPLGGSIKLVDLELEHPITDECAAVQVKSAASQKELDEYVSGVIEAGRFDRAFFICHSPKGQLKVPEDAEGLDIHVWTAPELTATVLKLGLQNWIIEKMGQIESGQVMRDQPGDGGMTNPIVSNTIEEAVEKAHVLEEKALAKLKMKTTGPAGG